MKKSIFILILAQPLLRVRDFFNLDEFGFKRPVLLYFKISKNAPWLIGGIAAEEESYLIKLQEKICKTWFYDRENTLDNFFKKNDADAMYLKTGFVSEGLKSIWLQETKIERWFLKTDKCFDQNAYYLESYPMGMNGLSWSWGKKIYTKDFELAQQLGDFSHPWIYKLDYDKQINFSSMQILENHAQIEYLINSFKEDSFFVELKFQSKLLAYKVNSWLEEILGPNTVFAVHSENIRGDIEIIFCNPILNGGNILLSFETKNVLVKYNQKEFKFSSNKPSLFISRYHLLDFLFKAEKEI